MVTRPLRIAALSSLLLTVLLACVPDQSCSNPPHIRQTTSISSAIAGATRQNPIDFGEVASYGDWNLRVIEFSQTADLVHARVEAVFSGSEDDEPGDLDSLKFCLAGSLHTLYLDATVSSNDDGPSPVFGDGYGDEQVRNGWLTFEDIADDDDEFVLAVREAPSILDRDADFLYLELKNGVSISRDRSEVQRSTTAGSEINSPIPLGESAITSAFQIEIADAYLGSEAEAIRKSTSFLNPEPRPEMTFFLFKVKVTNTARGNSPASISSTQFSADGFTESVGALIAGTTGSNASGSDLTKSAAANPWLELPGEQIEATLFQGGSLEGWVLLEVDGDTAPLVVYDPRLGTGLHPDEDRRYFLLTIESTTEEDGESSSSVTPAASQSSPSRRSS